MPLHALSVSRVIIPWLAPILSWSVLQVGGQLLLLDSAGIQGALQVQQGLSRLLFFFFFWLLLMWINQHANARGCPLDSGVDARQQAYNMRVMLRAKRREGRRGEKWPRRQGVGSLHDVEAHTRAAR